MIDGENLGVLLVFSCPSIRVDFMSPVSSGYLLVVNKAGHVPFQESMLTTMKLERPCLSIFVNWENPAVGRTGIKSSHKLRRMDCDQRNIKPS